MRKLIILAFIAMCLFGCASRRAPAIYGNFVQRTIPADDKLMANDVAKKLAVLYLPARTRINLRHATPDVFGSSLVAALRTKGYALAEFKPIQSAQVPSQSAVDFPGRSGDVALAYVIDQPLEGTQYRVTVHLNGQTVSRLYQAKDGTVAPAGYWVRKE
jgi:hypothetical protein